MSKIKIGDIVKNIKGKEALVWEEASIPTTALRMVREFRKFASDKKVKWFEIIPLEGKYNEGDITRSNTTDAIAPFVRKATKADVLKAYKKADDLTRSIIRRLVKGAPAEPKVKPMKTTKKKSFAIGDWVIDGYGNKGVVAEESLPPDKNWLDMQINKRMKKLPKSEKWYSVLCVNGGSVNAPVSLSGFIRKATLKDLRETYKNGNVVAKQELKILFPQLKKSK